MHALMRLDCTRGVFDRVCSVRGHLQVAAGVEPVIDPVAAKKAAEEAEERRLAEIRSLGTPVTPEHFATWKKRFYAEMALARSRCGRNQIPRLPEALRARSHGYAIPD